MSWESYWKDQDGDEAAKKLRGVHPVWRGIGFLMVVLIPVFSFALGDMLIKIAPRYVAGFEVPPELQGYFVVPFYGGVANIKGVLFLTVVLSIFFFALFAVFNAAMFQVMGGSPADKLQAPPEKKRKAKKKKYDL